MTHCARKIISRAACPGCRRAFGLVELLVAMAIIVVLLAIFMPVLASARRSQRSVQCMSNLQSIGAAFHAFALDNRGRLPNPSAADRSWEQMLLKYSGKSFACPADSELFPAVGSSYDWRDTGSDRTTMANRSLADVTRLDAVLAMDALPGWHARDKINVVRIDGSAISIPASDCFKDLSMAVRR